MTSLADVLIPVRKTNRGIYMAGVKFNHVCKRFKVEVVQDITTDFKDRAFLVLVGPSGGGKRTCLRMIAGLAEVSESKISIGERVVLMLTLKGHCCKP
jgi:ABC-type sugar transport system ATPase subunit